MKNKSKHMIPLIVTVGNVVILPYYIIWLKQVSLTFSLFAWFFAAFSFAAALGFQTFQTKKNKENSPIFFIYFALGSIYIFISFLQDFLPFLPYAALVFQTLLGFLQGYFRAWHIEQRSYRLHTVHHYLLIGITMVILSFVNIISPILFITGFGCLLCLCGLWDFSFGIGKRKS